MKLTEHFTIEEFEKSTVAEGELIDNTAPREVVLPLFWLADLLEDIRFGLNENYPREDGKDRVIKVLSGYRCPILNSFIGGEWNSQHLLGEASDILVPGITPSKVFQFIKNNGYVVDQCLLEFRSWIHISRTEISIPREQFLIASKDDNGNTVYTEA